MIPYQSWWWCCLVVWTSSAFSKLSQLCIAWYLKPWESLGLFLLLFQQLISPRNSSLRKPTLWPNGMNVWQWRNRDSMDSSFFSLLYHHPKFHLYLHICLTSNAVTCVTVLLKKQNTWYISVFLLWACIVKVITCKLKQSKNNSNNKKPWQIST